MDHPKKIFENLEQTIQKFAARKEKYVVNPKTDFTRNRKLNLPTLLRLILQMQGSSLNQELERFFHHALDLPTKSALVQQRKKLHYSIFEDIFHETNRHFPVEKTWHGYHLFAADGSDFNLPRDPSDTDTFITQPKTDGYNLLHANLLYDLLGHTYQDCVLQGKRKSDERDAMIQMLHHNVLPNRSIVIMDRGYESYNLFAHFKEMQGVDCICRVKNGASSLKFLKGLPFCEFDIEKTAEISITQTKEDKKKKRIHICNGSLRGKTLSPSTNLSSWDFPSPYKLVLRIVRFRIADRPGENGDVENNPENYETLVTTLPKNTFSIEKMKHLYHLRWRIEVSFRDLKYSIGLVNLHSKSRNSIYQEIFAHFIMYNFSQRIISYAIQGQEHPPNRKYIYQINITQAIHFCREFFSGALPLASLVPKIRRYILPVRPNRQDIRKLRIKSFVGYNYRVAA